MNATDFQKLSERTMPKESINPTPFDVQLLNYSIGIAGEAGEFLDQIKKSIFHGHELKTLQLGVELGDILHYIAGVCTLLDLDLSAVMEGNIAKLELRYPEGFSQKASQNREDSNESY